MIGAIASPVPPGDAASRRRPHVRTSQSAEPAPNPRRAARLQLEPLETRLAPAIAPWTSYAPVHGDLVDRLIVQLAPRAHDPSVFFQRLAAWTSASPGAENAGSLGADANRQLADMVGDCTVRANIFRTVAGRLHFSTRYVGLSNIPFQLTHSTVEVAWGRAWHYFDPTTGIHLARPGRNEALSLSAARWRWPDVTMVSPVIRRFQHRWSSQTSYRFEPLREGRITYHGRNAYDLLRTYFFSQAIQSSGRQPASVRAFIDLSQRPAGAVGRPDRSSSDVARALQSAGAKLGARLATSFGAFGGAPTTLEFFLKSRRAASTTFRLTLARGDPAQVEADLDPMVARWGYPDMQVKKSVEGRTVTFRFRALAPGVMLRIYAPQRATFRIDSYDWRVGTSRTTRLAPFAPLAGYIRASSAPDTGSPRYIDLASTRVDPRRRAGKRRRRLRRPGRLLPRRPLWPHLHPLAESPRRARRSVHRPAVRLPRRRASPQRFSHGPRGAGGRGERRRGRAGPGPRLGRGQDRRAGRLAVHVPRRWPAGYPSPQRRAGQHRRGRRLRVARVMTRNERRAGSSERGFPRSAARRGETGSGSDTGLEKQQGQRSFAGLAR